MKPKYKIIIVIQAVLGLSFLLWLTLASGFSEKTVLANGIQGAVLVVAVITAVISQAVADPKRLVVTAEVEHSIQTQSAVLTHDEVPGAPESYRVYFSITNASGFTWKRCEPSVSGRFISVARSLVTVDVR